MLYIAQNNVYCPGLTFDMVLVVVLTRSCGVYLNLHLVTQINIFHSKYC